MEARRQSWVVIGLMLVSAACGQDASEELPAAQAAPAEQPAAAGDSMAGMAGMGGISGMQMGTEMMTHVQGMQAMHGDSLMQMAPIHGQMLGNMMAQMDREMQGMNRPVDPQWTAVADSLRNDLVQMPQMSAMDMEAFLPAHRGRITRLMEMHRSMMGGR